MANAEQVAMLRRSVSEWNEWRKKNEHVPVDLNRADLLSADLSFANLSGADLRYVSLSGATLTYTGLGRAHLNGAHLNEARLNGAILTSADLRGADLRGTELMGAKLMSAQLCHTNLRGAELRHINLRGANLKSANLRDANFYDADLRSANFCDADLRGAELTGAYLSGANLSRADLTDADLTDADLNYAHLLGSTLISAHLNSAHLNGANLMGANLRGAELREAHLYEADLRGANLRGVDLSGADLRVAQMVGTQLPEANLSNCRVYGISAWNVNLEGSTQSNLIITDEGEPVITVDNLEIAQFIYLLIHNEKLRDVIDTVGKKTVLILGRFTEERKAVLDAIREELRKRDYIPILFDFDKPSSRDLTETVVTLAHMARFVIADLTDPKSIPHEMMSFVPGLPSVAVQPIILNTDRPYAMFEHLQRYPWVLPIHEYESQEQLIAQLPEKVIQPAEAKVNELRPK